MLIDESAPTEIDYYLKRFNFSLEKHSRTGRVYRNERRSRTFETFVRQDSLKHRYREIEKIRGEE